MKSSCSILGVKGLGCGIRNPLMIDRRLSPRHPRPLPTRAPGEAGASGGYLLMLPAPETSAAVRAVGSVAEHRVAWKEGHTAPLPGKLPPARVYLPNLEIANPLMVRRAKVKMEIEVKGV